MSWAECLGHAVFSPLLRDPDSFLRLRYECRGRVLRAIKIGDGPELDGLRRPQSVTQMARGTPQTRTIMAGAAQPSREVGNGFTLVRWRMRRRGPGSPGWSQRSIAVRCSPGQRSPHGYVPRPPDRFSCCTRFCFTSSAVTQLDWLPVNGGGW